MRHRTTGGNRLMSLVHRAELLIDADPQAEYSVAGLARAVGTSARSLTRAFRRIRGYSPMEAVRRTRLLRVRHDLLTAAPEERVTDAAMRWGFFHLGRFAGLYALHYGELPSVTRRRRATCQGQDVSRLGIAPCITTTMEA